MSELRIVIWEKFTVRHSFWASLFVRAVCHYVWARSGESLVQLDLSAKLEAFVELANTSHFEFLIMATVCWQLPHLQHPTSEWEYWEIMDGQCDPFLVVIYLLTGSILHSVSLFILTFYWSKWKTFSTFFKCSTLLINLF